MFDVRSNSYQKFQMRRLGMVVVVGVLKGKGSFLYLLTG